MLKGYVQYCYVCSSLIHSTAKPVLSDHLATTPREHSAILLTFIKLPFVFKPFVLSIFEWSLKTGFTVSWADVVIDVSIRLQSMVHHRKYRPAFELAKAFAKFEVATSNRLGGDASTRTYIISLLTLTLGQWQTRNVAQYRLYHMTYAHAKFEAVMSNGLGGNAFTWNILIWPWPKVKVTWSIALYIMLPMYLQSSKLLRPMVKEMHYQENTLFDLDPKVKGVKVTQNVPQYPRHHVTYAPAKFDIATSQR